MAGPRSPKHGIVPFTVLKTLFFLHGMKLFNNIRTYGWVVIPQTQPSAVHGVEYPFRLDVLQPFRNIQVYGVAALRNIPVTTQLILQRWRVVSFSSYAEFQQRSKKRMVVLPQTHSCSFHGVENSFYLDGTKLFKNIRTYAWAVLPHTRPSSFYGVEKPFRVMLCSQLNSVKLMAGPRSPTSPVTAQLIFQRWGIFSFCCFANFQQRSNERMVVFPQTRSEAFHGVEDSFYLDGTKLFKNLRTYGWAVLPQTRPSSFHGVEEHFRLDVLQPCKNIQVYGWAALPNIPCHGPAHFATLKNHFVLMLCRLSTTFK